MAVSDLRLTTEVWPSMTIVDELVRVRIEVDDEDDDEVLE